MSLNEITGNEKRLSDFFDRQLYLLKQERDAEIEQNSLLLTNCSRKLLEQRGLAVLSLSVNNTTIGIGGRTLIELGRSAAYTTDPVIPPHSLRPGDLARLEKPQPKGAGAKKTSKTSSGSRECLVEGVVYKVSDNRIVITVDSKKEEMNEDLDLPDLCDLVKLANTVTHDRMEKVMSSLCQTMLPDESNKAKKFNFSSETSILANILLGIQPLEPPVDVSGMMFYDKSLNESQKSAIQFALGAKNLACIHGPPGTGKTHTLLEVIRQSLFPRFGNTDQQPLKPMKKILVCGASNLSVDNILERLLRPPLDGMSQIKCTRVGHPARIKGSGDTQDATLDAQSTRSEQAALVKDVKNELSESLLLVAGKAKGQKGKKPRGDERKKLWDDIKELRKEYRRREKGVVSSILSEAQVVLATCHSSGGRVLENTDFDLVIIDEATQALEAACWIPIVKSKKLILAGDPLQLPPTVIGKDRLKESKKSKTEKSKTQKTPLNRKASKSKSDPTKTESKVIEPPATKDSSKSEGESLEEESQPSSVKNLNRSNPVLYPPKDLSVTMFERLEKMHGPSIKRMLEIQYRMHDKICEFPSKILYQSRLKSDESVATHLLSDLKGVQAKNEISNDSESSLETLNTPIVFIDTAGCEYFERNVEGTDEGSKLNENEAMLVKAWVEKLTKAGVLPVQIAVITPYQAQVAHMSNILSATYNGELEIGTVDGMQGREKEAIIISLVRSNDKHEVGFLKDKRRLNVAMTRAKRHLCVIGDSSTVQHGGKFLKDWMAWLEENSDVYYGGLDELPL